MSDAPKPPDEQTRQEQAHHASGEEPPPVLGSWRKLYLVVLGVLALQVVVYALWATLYQ